LPPQAKKNLCFGFKSGLDWSEIEFCALHSVGVAFSVIENGARKLKSEARSPVLYIKNFDGGLGFCWEFCHSSLIQGLERCKGCNKTINLLTNEELKKYYFYDIKKYFFLLVMFNIKIDTNFFNSTQN
jgi:hypothetical protein